MSTALSKTVTVPTTAFSVTPNANDNTVRGSYVVFAPRVGCMLSDYVNSLADSNSNEGRIAKSLLEQFVGKNALRPPLEMHYERSTHKKHTSKEHLVSPKRGKKSAHSKIQSTKYQELDSTAMQKEELLVSPKGYQPVPSEMKSIEYQQRDSDSTAMQQKDELHVSPKVGKQPAPSEIKSTLHKQLDSTAVQKEEPLVSTIKDRSSTPFTQNQQPESTTVQKKNKQEEQRTPEIGSKRDDFLGLTTIERYQIWKPRPLTPKTKAKRDKWGAASKAWEAAASRTVISTAHANGTKDADKIRHTRVAGRDEMYSRTGDSGSSGKNSLRLAQVATGTRTSRDETRGGALAAFSGGKATSAQLGNMAVMAVEVAEQRVRGIETLSSKRIRIIEAAQQRAAKHRVEAHLRAIDMVAANKRAREKKEAEEQRNREIEEIKTHEVKTEPSRIDKKTSTVDGEDNTRMVSKSDRDEDATIKPKQRVLNIIAAEHDRDVAVAEARRERKNAKRERRSVRFSIGHGGKTGRDAKARTDQGDATSDNSNKSPKDPLADDAAAHEHVVKAVEPQLKVSTGKKAKLGILNQHLGRRKSAGQDGESNVAPITRYDNPEKHEALRIATHRFPVLVPAGIMFDKKPDLCKSYKRKIDGMKVDRDEYQAAIHKLYDLYAQVTEHEGFFKRKVPADLLSVLKKENKTDLDHDVFHDVVIPSDLVETFLHFARKYTARNLECMGLLYGYTISSIGVRVVTDLVLPDQKVAPYSCEIIGHEDLAKHVKAKPENSLIGWIHTHPSYFTFMTSSDLHTQGKQQALNRDSIAIVCAKLEDYPHGKNAIFTMTSYGMQEMAKCTKTNFHRHDPVQHLYKLALNVYFNKDAKIIVEDKRAPIIRLA